MSTWQPNGGNTQMPKVSRNTAPHTFRVQHELLDPTNVQLLAELKDDPRLPMTALGRRVGLSAPAVTERVRRLEEAGVIRDYRLDIDPAALGFPLTAYIRLRPNPGQLQKAAELARTIPEVAECHRITGDDCFIIKIHLPAIDHLDGILD